jgi:hypothetical protein
MGLFGRKKKDKSIEKTSVASNALGSEELLAVIGAAVAASEDAAHIAVIGAAIAAYESDNVRSDLRIAKINRIAGQIPAWGIAGNRDAIDARRM